MTKLKSVDINISNSNGIDFNAPVFTSEISQLFVPQRIKRNQLNWGLLHSEQSELK